MYSVIGLALFHICVSRAIVRESVLGANFSANGLWPDKNLSGNKFPYLQGYWNISNVKLEEVSAVEITFKTILHICSIFD